MYLPGSDLAARYPQWRVIRRPISGAYGVTLHRRRLIIVCSSLSRAAYDSTLAHEIVHLDRGERCTFGNAVVDTRRELIVCRSAARRQLCVQRVAEMPLFGKHVIDVADELGVDVDTFRIWWDDLNDEEKAIINGRQSARQEGAA